VEKRADLYEDGVANPEKALQSMLGHSNVTTTMTFYGHVSPQDEAQEADSNAAFIKKLTRED
jgi:integrase